MFEKLLIERRQPQALHVGDFEIDRHRFATELDRRRLDRNRRGRLPRVARAHTEHELVEFCDLGIGEPERRSNPNLTFGGAAQLFAGTLEPQAGEHEIAVFGSPVVRDKLAELCQIAFEMSLDFEIRDGPHGPLDL